MATGKLIVNGVPVGDYKENNGVSHRTQESVFTKKNPTIEQAKKEQVLSTLNPSGDPLLDIMNLLAPGYDIISYTKIVAKGPYDNYEVSTKKGLKKIKFKFEIS